MLATWAVQLARITLVALVGALVVVAPRVAQADGKCELTVKKGDTVSRIARRHGVTEKDLIRANPKLKKDPNRLRVGDKLDICKAKRLQQSKPSKCGSGGRLITHQVGKGETLGGIAARYSTSRDAVRRYNPRLKKRTNSMIRVGESIKVCTTNRKYTNRSWLKEGVQLPAGEGYEIRRPGNAWGTKTSVDAIVAALAEYRERQPESPPVQVGDISRENGGPLREHVSHQEGRDVDIGLVWHPEPEDGGQRRIDIARTWLLVRSFVHDPDVAVIFIDYRLQKRLYEYAQKLGEDQVFLDRAFEYPRNGDEQAVLYHWRGHTHHFHVRFDKRAVEPDPELASRDES